MASKIIGIACESQNAKFKSSWHDEYLNPDPEKWVTGAYIKIGYFATEA